MQLLVLKKGGMLIMHISLYIKVIIRS